MSSPRGRPPKSDPRLTRDIILTAAAKRMEESQSGAFSLRRLATDLGVTPMSLYVHVDGIDGVLDALAERCFSGIPDTDLNDPRDGLRVLLAWYCERVLTHPRLTTVLVSRRGALPIPHQAWTDRVVSLVHAEELPTDWSDILVDHLHGFALSHAAGGSDPLVALEIYRRQIDVLLGKRAISAASITC